MISIMEKSSANTTSAVKPPLSKNEVPQARKNDFNYISVIGSLNFLKIKHAPRHNSRFINACDSVLVPSYHTIDQLNTS